MRNIIKISLVTIFVVFSFSYCSKEQFNGTSVASGYVYLVNSNLSNSPILLKNQVLYINTGSDTGSYFFQTTTDSSGHFVIPYLDIKKTYILFSHYINNGVYYSGSCAVSFSGVNSLNLSYPLQNIKTEIELHFQDSLGNFFPNFPFRMYTSRLLAVDDFAGDTVVKYAYVNSKSDTNGVYMVYNPPSVPKYYYIVSKNTKFNIYTFDSIHYFNGGDSTHHIVTIRSL
jgi:hypothetical protein